MPKKERSKPALLLIDLITDFDFEDGPKLQKNVLKIVANIGKLRDAASAMAIPVIFVNDNYGNWSEDFRHQVERIRESSTNAAKILDVLRPETADFYILKPHRSAFYETPLEVLLRSLGVNELILAGQTTDICVSFSANDAYMRHYRLHIPNDCSAAVERPFHTAALKLLERTCEANTSGLESAVRTISKSL